MAWQDSPPASPAAGSGAGAPAQPEPLAAARINELVEQVGADFVANLLVSHLGHTQAQMLALREALADGKLPAAAEIFHAMKGASGTLGFVRAEKLAAGAEMAARRGEGAGLETVAAELEAATEAGAAGARALLAGRADATAG